METSIQHNLKQQTTYILLVIPLYILSFSFLNVFAVFINKFNFIQFIAFNFITVAITLIILIKNYIKIRNITTMSIFASIVYITTHYTLFWYFIWYFARLDRLVDARIFFVDELAKCGNISSLDIYSRLEGTYYTSYPSIWLIALSIHLVPSLSSFQALALSHLTAYICSLLLMYAFIRHSYNKEFNTNKDIGLILLILFSAYVMQNSQMLVSANSLGILGVVLLLRFMLVLVDNTAKKFNRIKYVILLMAIPTLLASPNPLLVGYSLFSLLLFNSLILNIFTNKKIVLNDTISILMRSFIIFLTGTWLYTSAIFLPIILNSGSYYLNIALSILSKFDLTRPSVSQSIYEQKLHIVYPYHSIVMYIYYLVPLVVGFTLSLILVIRCFFNIHSCSPLKLALYLTILQLQIISIGTIFVFGYKGVENALARYAYLYITPLNLLVILEVFYRHVIKCFSMSYLYVILISLSIILLFLVINLEVFYSPWFSLKEVPDLFQIEVFLKGK